MSESLSFVAGAPRVDDDVHSVASEAACNGFADPRGATSHKCASAFRHDPSIGRRDAVPLRCNCGGGTEVHQEGRKFATCAWRHPSRFPASIARLVSTGTFSTS